MVMKATPFFSKDIHAVAARAYLLERLAPVALINLSYLRREDLFPDAVGPALLFFARCALGPDADRLLAGSIPWTPDFRRTVFSSRAWRNSLCALEKSACDITVFKSCNLRNSAGRMVD